MRSLASCAHPIRLTGPRGLPPEPGSEKIRFMRRLLGIITLLGTIPAILSSCGPPVPASSPAAPPVADGARGKEELQGDTILEAIERRVAESIAKLRESAVALEYA